jgi:MFS transporter, DHA2 family, multidrug resistance protein
MASSQRLRTAPQNGLDLPRRYWAWATIMVGITLAVLDGTIANVALPTIAADFQASPSVSIWIVNGYQLAIVTALLPFASLGEIHGYRRVYIAGVALFTIASLGCMLSGSLLTLTAFRIVQGFGAAGLMSVNTALLRYTVPREKFGVAIGINALFVAAAATVGPSLGGFILSALSWPWLFAINLPLGVIAIALGVGSLPDSDLAARRFDWISALLSAATIGLVVTTIDSAGHELSWWSVGAQLAGSLVAAILLVRRESRVPEPLLPLDLLKMPIFSLSIATSVASFVAQMLAFVSLPFILQSIYGFPPVEVGLLMMPWPFAVAIVAPIAGKLSDRYSPGLLCSVGLFALAAGLALLASLPAHPPVSGIAWRMALAGAGFGLFQTPNNRAMVGAPPKSRSGAASGMLGTARLTGQSIGAALVALLLGLFGIGGARYSLAVGVCFAVVAAGISLTRLGRVNPAHAEEAVPSRGLPDGVLQRSPANENRTGRNAAE